VPVAEPYRHSRKAGNPGDVVKHGLLVGLLGRVSSQGPGPLRYFECHAGAALHRLAPAGEWREGLGRLRAAGARGPYLDAVAELGGSDAYPGSSLLVQRLLGRRGTSVQASLCELDPAVLQELREQHRSLGLGEPCLIGGDGVATAWAALESPVSLRPQLLLFDPPDAPLALAAETLRRAAAAGCQAFAWLPLLAGPGAVPPAEAELFEIAGALGLCGLRARWPRPGRQDLCTRGCVCLGWGWRSEDWSAAVAELLAAPLPADWELAGWTPARGVAGEPAGPQPR